MLCFPFLFSCAVSTLPAVDSGVVVHSTPALVKAALLPPFWEGGRELRPSRRAVQDGTPHLWVWEHVLFKDIANSTNLCLSSQTMNERKKKSPHLMWNISWNPWFRLSTEISFGNLFKIRVYSIVCFISFL